MSDDWHNDEYHNDDDNITITIKSLHKLIKNSNPIIINNPTVYIINQEKNGGEAMGVSHVIRLAPYLFMTIAIVILTFVATISNWQLPVMLIGGFVLVSVLLTIAIFIPIPTEFQYLVFRIVLSLAAAACAAPIPGLLNVTIPNVSAGGALAVFVFVYWWNPAALLTRSD